MPFLAIDLPTEDGGSDYEFLGSDSSSSGDESEVGSTHSSVGVDTPPVSDLYPEVRLYLRRLRIGRAPRSAPLQLHLARWFPSLVLQWSARTDRKSVQRRRPPLVEIPSPLLRSSTQTDLEQSRRQLPRQVSRRSVDTPVPTVEQAEALLVASFDGSARVKRGGGAFSAILWRLPEWAVVKAASGWKADMTDNEEEYSGLLLCFDLLEDQDRTRLVICGDSNLVMRQMKGEIDCKAPALTLLRQKALRQLGTWLVHDLLHVKRAWNASADSLASAALQREAGVIVQGQDCDDLVMLNRLSEILTATAEETTRRISAMATRPRRKVPNQEVLQEDAVRQLRVDRIRQGQNEEKWIANLKHYLRGQVADLDREEARACSNLADDFEMDEQDLLYYCPPPRTESGQREGRTAAPSHPRGVASGSAPPLPRELGRRPPGDQPYLPKNQGSFLLARAVPERTALHRRESTDCE
ncbi:hypothetical protein PR003_g24777, partial [Phytophthora rubi]